MRITNSHQRIQDICFFSLTHRPVKGNKLVSSCVDDSTARISAELVRNEQPCKCGANWINTRKRHIWKTAIALSIACSSISRLRSSLCTPELAGPPLVPSERNQAPGNQRTPLEAGTFVSTSVYTLPVPERPGTFPTGPEYNLGKILQNSQQSSHKMQISINPLR